MHKDFSDCTNLNKVSKTVRFELIPEGKTLENIEAGGLLCSDIKRAEDYKLAKKIIDRYHRSYIEKQLKDAELTGVEECYLLYCKPNRTEKENSDFKKSLAKLRKQVKDFLTSSEEYKRLAKKELIEEDLPAFVTENTEEADIIKSFVGFTTYFSGFNKNRENMYSDEEKNTSIAYRVINQNMLRYFDNIRVLKKFMQLNTDDAIDEIETIYADELNDKSINDFFSVENYSLFLSQSGIDSYNRIIGGYATDDRTK